MEKRKREIIALILLFVLLAAGLGFFGWYLVTGHNWNVAATTIDDMTGSMDGYVVLLYEGTDAPDADLSANSELNDDAVSSATILSNARKSYCEKGATVFALRTGTYSYTEPFVLLRNDYRVGFLPVEKDTPYLTIDRQVALLQQRGADVIVVLEYSENEYIETVPGIDIILELGETPKASSESASDEAASNDAAADDDASSNAVSGKKDSGESASAEASGSMSSEAKEGDLQGDPAANASKLYSSSSESGRSSSSSSDVAGATANASSSKAADATQSKKNRKSDALIVNRCDRGLVSAVLISPNNIVSSKTISK